MSSPLTMRYREGTGKVWANRRPFWLPASSFYFLVAGVSAASFFLVIGILHDDGSEPEIVTAGLIASGVLVSGVLLRELVLRNAREKFIAERNQLDNNLKKAAALIDEDPSRKFTLERNAAAIHRIRTKSEAAMVFDRIAQGHREVFELCAEYRRIVGTEIRNIHPNSPRLKALIKGNEFALKTHKFHLLRWAELESKALAGKAQNSEDPATRTEYTQNAAMPLQFALDHYPDEAALKDSLSVLDELLISMKLSEFLLIAENAIMDGDRATARQNYLEALTFIEGKEMSQSQMSIRAQIEEALLSLKVG